MRVLSALIAVLVCAAAVSAARVTDPNDICIIPMDVMLVLDGSASIAVSSWEEVKQFSEDLVSTFKVSSNGTHVGVVQFSEIAEVEVPLEDDAQDIDNKIDHMRKMAMNTAIAQGIELAQKQFGRAGVNHTMVLMTDGVNNQPGSPKKQADLAKAAGTEIFVIGVGDQVDPSELMPLASDPVSTHYYNPKSFADLQAILANMTSYTCDFYKCNTATGNCDQVPKGSQGAESLAQCKSQCKAPPTTPAPTTPAPTTPAPTPAPGGYACDLETFTCIKSTAKNSTDLPTCEASCEAHTPTVLIGTWRGVEINKAFAAGEWDVIFTADNATFVDPKGTHTTYEVRSNGSSITFLSAAGDRMADYSIAQGPETLMATLALGASGAKTAITSFDTAMTAAGDMEFMLFACTNPGAVCDFTKVIEETRREAISTGNIQIDESEDEEMIRVQDASIVDPPPSLCSTPAEVMFVIDGSGSLAGADWQHMKDFCDNLTAQFNVTNDMVHVGAYEFSSINDGRLIDALDASAPTFDAKVTAMTEIGDLTAIGDGIKNGQTQLAAGRTGVPHLMILMTDGIENQQSNPVQEAALAKSALTEIVVLGIGNKVDMQTLSAVASQPASTHLYNPTDFASLSKFILSVLDVVCPQPIYKCENSTTTDAGNTTQQCVQVAPGTPGATSMSVCNQTCGHVPPPPPPVPTDKYTCNMTTLTCEKTNSTTGTPLATCNQTCGSVAPTALRGEWRGVEISSGYDKGEFAMNVSNTSMTLKDATGNIMFGYVQALSAFQIGLDVKTGPSAGKRVVGMFLPGNGPETEFITLCMSQPGYTTLPTTFDTCMASPNFYVLNMGKCLDNKPCDFSAAMPATPPHME